MGRQNAVDLCLQCLYWLKEEQQLIAEQETNQKKSRQKGTVKSDERLCKFEMVNIHKMEPLIIETLSMMNIDQKSVNKEMKRFLRRYPHYRPPRKVDTTKLRIDDDRDDGALSENEKEKEDGTGSKRDDNDDDYNIDDDIGRGDMSEEEEDDDGVDVPDSITTKTMRSHRRRNGRRGSSKTVKG